MISYNICKGNVLCCYTCECGVKYCSPLALMNSELGGLGCCNVPYSSLT